MNKNIIITILLVVAFLAIILFLDWPAFEKVTDTRNKIKIIKNTIEEKEELSVKVEQLKEVYNARQEDIKKLYYVLPEKQQVPELIVQFETLASGNGLFLEEIAIEPKQRKPAPDEEEKTEKSIREKILNQVNVLEASLVLSGNYQSFKNFLSSLEQNVRLMDVTKIEISSKKGEENAVLNFKVVLETYYQR